MTEDLLYEVKDGVATITIHREASRNAISQATEENFTGASMPAEDTFC